MLLNQPLDKKTIKKLYDLNQILKKYFTRYLFYNGFIFGEVSEKTEVVKQTAFSINSTFVTFPEVFEGFIIQPEAFNLAIKAKGLDTISIIDDKLNLINSIEKLVLPIGIKAGQADIVDILSSSQLMRIDTIGKPFIYDEYTIPPETLVKLCEPEKVVIKINEEDGIVLTLTISAIPAIKKANMVRIRIKEGDHKDVFFAFIETTCDDYTINTLLRCVKVYKPKD